MSEKTTDTPVETVVEETPKPRRFSNKQIATTVAALAGAAAVVVVAVKLKNGSLEDLSVSDLTVVEAVTD